MTVHDNEQGIRQCEAKCFSTKPLSETNFGKTFIINIRFTYLTMSVCHYVTLCGTLLFLFYIDVYWLSNNNKLTTAILAILPPFFPLSHHLQVENLSAQAIGEVTGFGPSSNDNKNPWYCTLFTYSCSINSSPTT